MGVVCSESSSTFLGLIPQSAPGAGPRWQRSLGAQGPKSAPRRSPCAVIQKQEDFSHPWAAAALAAVLSFSHSGYFPLNALEAQGCEAAARTWSTPSTPRTLYQSMVHGRKGQAGRPPAASPGKPPPWAVRVFVINHTGECECQVPKEVTWNSTALRAPRKLHLFQMSSNKLSSTRTRCPSKQSAPSRDKNWRWLSPTSAAGCRLLVGWGGQLALGGCSVWGVIILEPLFPLLLSALWSSTADGDSWVLRGCTHL